MIFSLRVRSLLCHPVLFAKSLRHSSSQPCSPPFPREHRPKGGYAGTLAGHPPHHALAVDADIADEGRVPGCDRPVLRGSQQTVGDGVTNSWNWLRGSGESLTPGSEMEPYSGHPRRSARARANRPLCGCHTNRSYKNPTRSRRTPGVAIQRNSTAKPNARSTMKKAVHMAR